MSSKGEQEGPSLLAFKQMLQAKRSRLCDDAAIASLLSRYASKASAVMAEVSGLRLEFSLEAIDQCPMQEIVRSDGAATFIATIPEGNGLAIARFDKLIMFRAVDAMFGGTQSGGIRIPERPPTALERNLACFIAGALLRQLADHLSELRSFTVQSERYADPDDAALRQRFGEFLVMRLSAGEFGGIVTLAVPVAGLDCARDHPGEAADDNAIVDPLWAGQIEKSVAAASLKITAVADGPELLLGDIARLSVGSIIALGSDTLRCVSLKCEEAPVFVGRLGQSRGCLTVCLERPLPVNGKRNAK